MAKNSKTAETSISYITLVTESLDLLKWPCLPKNINNKIQKIIDSFSNYPSILKIKYKIRTSKTFLL